MSPCTSYYISKTNVIQAHHLFWASSSIRNSTATIAGSSISILTKDLEADYGEKEY